MPNLNTSILGECPIVLPPISEQVEIADALSVLDDRIQLNLQMSETQEAMARALFKSWFVDFDPVRAKAEGRATGLPKHIDDLFPDSFVEYGDGRRPGNWPSVPLGDLVEFAYGKALKEEDRRPGHIPVYGSNGQVGWHDEILALGPGIVVGRKGNPGTVVWSQPDFFVIDTAFYAVPRSGIGLHFLYFALSAMNLQDLAADSAVPGLNRNMTYASILVRPPDALVDVFERFTSFLFERSQAIAVEQATLSSLRDSLLAQLVSGHLRLPA
jgi:type I restriction enzyme S subunit